MTWETDDWWDGVPIPSWWRPDESEGLVRSGGWTGAEVHVEEVVLHLFLLLPDTFDPLLQPYPPRGPIPPSCPDADYG